MSAGVLRSAFCVALCLAGLAEAQRARAPGGGGPPNVLVVVGDDLGVDKLGLYGSTGDYLPRTPVLEALAERGVVFRNAWANPVCSASRASLQTGQYAFRTGVGGGGGARLAPSAITIPEMLRLAGSGHKTAFFGKWHLGDELDDPNVQGWDRFAGILGNFPAGYSYNLWPKVVDGLESIRSTYAPLDNTEDALDWMRAATGPWVVCLSYNLAHAPWHRPPAELYTSPVGPASGFDFRPRAHRAMIEALDTLLGRVLQELPKNTYVIFVGDNGSPSYAVEPPFDPERSKGTVYEEGVHVPLIVAGPGVKHGRSDALVHLCDVFATIAELAGVELRAVMPEGVVLDSVSFAASLVDPGGSSKRSTLLAERFSNPAFAFPETPARPYLCQESVELVPGSAAGPQLSICGPPLAFGNANDLFVRGAPPGANGIVLTADALVPTDWNGVTILSDQPAQRTVRANPLGELFLRDFVVNDVENNFPGIRTYAQVVFESAGEPGGYLASNAVEVELLPFNVKAVRDRRYKLHSNLYGGEQLYDLLQDPLEQQDLLRFALGAEERSALDGLRVELERLRRSD